MAVDDAGDDDGGDGDAVGDFAEGGGKGREGWRGGHGGCVVVDYDGGGEVHAYVDGLEEEERFGVMGWGVEFGDEGEKVT